VPGVAATDVREATVDVVLAGSCVGVVTTDDEVVGTLVAAVTSCWLAVRTASISGAGTVGEGVDGTEAGGGIDGTGAIARGRLSGLVSGMLAAGIGSAADTGGDNAASMATLVTHSETTRKRRTGPNLLNGADRETVDSAVSDSAEMRSV